MEEHDVNLKEHLLAIIDAHDRRYEQRFKDSQTAVDAALAAARTAVDAALTSAKEAVMKAEVASEKRFESVNEFRATLSDQQSTLMPRIEAEARMARVETDITELKKMRDVGSGRSSGLKDSWVLIVVIVTLVGGILAIIATFFAHKP